MVRSRTSSWRMRPSRSKSTPSRNAPLVAVRLSRLRRSKSACRIATPPGNTRARSGRRPRSLSSSTWPASIIVLRSRLSAAAVIPFRDHPFMRRMFSAERIVPDAPTAWDQPDSRNERSMVRNSLCAFMRAAWNASRVRAPSAKYFFVSPTHPTLRLWTSCASKCSPRMHSVLPPPMSTTRRRPGSSGSEWATPR